MKTTNIHAGIDPLTKPKTYVANYLFNYFGGDKVGERVIVGAGIDVAFRPYKNGNLVQFQSEKETYFSQELPSKEVGISKRKRYLSDAVTVSFDRDNCFKLEINPFITKEICNHFGWDSIFIEVADVELDYMKNPWLADLWYCGEEIFTKFIKEHVDDFDISDNIIAQCPSYSWLYE